ncbi:MAG: mechanosensitive ion channel family protein [Anaerolineales bacterium]
MNITETLETLLSDVVYFIPNLLVALVVFVITLWLAGVAARQAEESAKKRIEEPEIVEILVRITRWGVLILGTLVALEQVNFNITGFLTGLGILGFTVGFALQDISRNFVAGILLILRRPFNIGDAIKIGDFSGAVLKINMRDTVIRTWDGEMVIIPNIDVFTQAITNYTALPLRRRTVKIGLGYGQDLRQAVEILIEALRNVDGVLESPAPEIYAQELGDSVLNFAAYFWLNQKTHGLFKVQSDAIQAINTAAERAGIDMPYPTQVVHLQAEPHTLPAAQESTAPDL